MTKAQEIELLAQFIARVPRETYLASFLEGALDAFGNAIAQDLAFPTLAQIWRDRQMEAEHARDEGKRLTAQLEKLRDDVRQAERLAARHRADLDECRAIARRLAAV